MTLRFHHQTRLWKHFKMQQPLSYLPMILMGKLSFAADTMAEHIVAAPPMSARMRSMFAEGLMEIPPLYGREIVCNNGESKAESSHHFLKTRDMVSETPGVMTYVRFPGPHVGRRERFPLTSVRLLWHLGPHVHIYHHNK